MNTGSSLIDILIFGVIAGVLLYRLRSVLGERDENEQLPPLTLKTMPTENAGTSAPPSGQTGGQVSTQWANSLPDFAVVATATAHHQMVPVLAADPAFNPRDFLDKAQKAFALIIKAYSEGNRNSLNFLLAPDLLPHFIAQIDAREAARETYYVVLHHVTKAVIARAALEGTQAFITVDFTAEQSITHKDVNGTILGSGDSYGDGHKQTTKDRWTFTRDLRSNDTVWRLCQTEDDAD